MPRGLIVTDYATCKALAKKVHGNGAEIIRYASVRDPAEGAKLAVLTCRTLAAQ